MTDSILTPALALICWTLVMWIWMYATRIPAMSRAKVDAINLVGTTGRSLDELLPPQVKWKAHDGVVMKADGEKLPVAFKKAGTKKVVASSESAFTCLQTDIPSRSGMIQSQTMRSGKRE